MKRVTLRIGLLIPLLHSLDKSFARALLVIVWRVLAVNCRVLEHRDSLLAQQGRCGTVVGLAQNKTEGRSGHGVQLRATTRSEQVSSVARPRSGQSN